MSTPRHAWTAAEVAILRLLYPTTRAKHIAPRLPGRSIRQILGKAWRLGLRKPLDVIAQHARESMADPAHAARQTRFAKGHRTWNTGMKGWQAGGRSVQTQFQPGTLNGRAAKLYVPIGTERVNADGYRERKITEAGRGSQRWRAVHVLLWEAAHGPLPAGHLVVFRNRDKTDIRLDNLELISRAENLRRNSVHNLPKPLAELVQLRGALVRKINRQTKGQPHADQ